MKGKASVRGVRIAMHERSWTPQDAGNEFTICFYIFTSLSY
jgi:hypothetical protein